jgi:tetratricopeptide (TPR) repeat protein
MAEAYLRIQELDQAISSYRAALLQSPNDASLASRIGYILVKKHDYLSAIEYYETALMTAPDQIPLRMDLARLLARLSKYDQALRVIESAPSIASSSSRSSNGSRGGGTHPQHEIKDMLLEIELKLLLPIIYTGIGHKDQCIESLLHVCTLQKAVLEKLRDEQPDELTRQQRALASTNYKLAQIYVEQKDWYRQSPTLYDQYIDSPAKLCVVCL